jgi:hypothetical protein
MAVVWHEGRNRLNMDSWWCNSSQLFASWQDSDWVMQRVRVSEKIVYLEYESTDSTTWRDWQEFKIVSGGREWDLKFLRFTEFAVVLCYLAGESVPPIRYMEDSPNLPVHLRNQRLPSWYASQETRQFFELDGPVWDVDRTTVRRKGGELEIWTPPAIMRAGGLHRHEPRQEPLP